MRHKKAKRRLGRSKGEREACMRNVAASLLTFEKITTTMAKAKEARRLAEKLITLAKSGTLSDRRHAASLLGQNKKLVQELFKNIAPRFKNRCGGYTRIIQKGRRYGDNALLVILELTEQKEKKKPLESKTAKKEAPKAESEKEKKAEAVTEKIKPVQKRSKTTEKKPKEQFFRRIFKSKRDSL